MNWFVLVASGLFEAVWATALGQSDGLRKPLPSLIFVVASIISLGGLAWAMTSIPTGTAYAVDGDRGCDYNRVGASYGS